MRHDLSPREIAAIHTLVERDGFRASVLAIATTLAARCTRSDYHPIVVYGARDAAEQERLYAKGRTAPGPIVTNARAGQSAHCYAAAADIALVLDSGAGWLAGDHPAWLELAELVRARGLITGTDFRAFADRAHLEHPRWRELARAGELKLWEGTTT